MIAWWSLIAVLLLYVAAATAYWLWAAHALGRMARDVSRLESLDSPDPPAWPRLSVIVPACDEADKIEAAARTLLAQDYPDLEIILVDDRSRDGTGEIVDRLAACEPRVRAVHVTSLPAGWLGKVNALNAGLRHAGGELLLFTDADVHYAPCTLRRAVAHVQHRGLDFLAAFPDLWPTRPLVDAMIAVAIRQIVMVLRPWKLPDPRSRAFMGVGAFNMVRRAALDRTAGLEWLRLEVADDAGLAMMLKRSGARCELVNAFGSLRLTWYRTWGEVARGSEKAFATSGQCTLWRMVVMAGWMLAMECSPLLCLLAPLAAPALPAAWAALAVPAAWALALAMGRRWIAGKLRAGLLGPLAAPAAALLFVRAGILGRRRGGVMWRGTLYPCDELRRNQRVRFP